MSKTHLTEQKFSDFALHPKVVEALEKKGFHNCTPIQALALPLTLAGRDVAGQAQTGTGKTMAFLTSTFHYLLSHPAIADRKVNQPRALIMAPTRELAVQIHADAEPLAEATGLKLGLAYGGDGYDKQLKVLESGVDILIGTTGRLIDYAKQNHINLGAIQVVVLDEADRMYDLGFIKDIRWLFRRMPPANQRFRVHQTLPAVDKILRRYRCAIRPFCVIAQGKSPDTVVITFPLSRNAGDNLPFLVLIHQSFKQIANDLNLWQAHGFSGIQRRRLIFNVAHQLLLLCQYCAARNFCSIRKRNAADQQRTTRD